ncbi:MAG: hypothetical protein GF401_09055 [Chitinivibrionales bacterium]|nr:hypothetical protein [Chitinivibrionales bacterium]
MMSNPKNQSSRTVESEAEAVSGTAKKVGDQIKREGSQFINQEKSAAASEVQKIGMALHSAAQKLRENNSSLADWFETTANTIDQASNNLAGRDIGDLINTSQEYSRKHPGLVIGGMFLSGIAASRFFRASTSPDGHEAAQPVQKEMVATQPPLEQHSEEGAAL